MVPRDLFHKARRVNQFAAFALFLIIAAAGACGTADPETAGAAEAPARTSPQASAELSATPSTSPMPPAGYAWVIFGGDTVVAEEGSEALGSATAADLHHEARAVLEAFATSELRTRLERVDVIGRELPMLAQRDDGAVNRGNIDLLYRDDDDTLVVADFKTDRGDDDAAIADRYRPQLETYVDAVTRALDLDTPPRGELWMLRSGKRLTV